MLVWARWAKNTALKTEQRESPRESSSYSFDQGDQNAVGTGSPILVECEGELAIVIKSEASENTRYVEPNSPLPKGSFALALPCPNIFAV